MIVTLPYTKPPLSLNGRLHWRAEVRIKAEVRAIAAMLTRRHVLPHVPAGTDHVTVVLHYVPRDKRTRDTDNLVLTLKPCKDGLVDAGLVPDDNPTYMTAPMPVIDPPDRANPRLYLDITFTEVKP